VKAHGGGGCGAPPSARMGSPAAQLISTFGIASIQPRARQTTNERKRTPAIRFMDDLLAGES
jgi:hypothetical protein